MTTIESFVECAGPWVSMLSCIEASRVAIECLRRFSIAAKPVPVALVVEWKEGQKAFVTGLSAEEKTAAMNEVPNGWDGHLIVMATEGDKNFLLDGTLARATHEIGLDMTPFVLVVPYPADIDPASMRANLELTGDTGEHIVVRYQSLDDDSWVTAPGWEPSHLWPMINDICGQMMSDVASLPVAAASTSGSDDSFGQPL